MKKYFLSCTFILLHFIFQGIFTKTFAQQKNNEFLIDSLLATLPNTKQDTDKIKTLNLLCREYANLGENEKAMQYGTQALSLAKSLRINNTKGWPKGIAKSYNNIGNIYKNQSNYTKALEMYYKSLKINEAIGDKRSISACYNKIGIVYSKISDVSKSLEMYYKSLKIDESIGDKLGLGNCYNNIGIVYRNQGNYSKAMEMYQKSLQIRMILLAEKPNDFEINDGISSNYTNIGNLYNSQSDSDFIAQGLKPSQRYEKALEMYFKSLIIDKKNANKPGIAYCYTNISSLYAALYQNKIFDSGLYLKQINNLTDAIKISIPYSALLDTALSLSKRALTIDKEIGDVYHQTYTLSGLGEICFLKKNIKEAISYYKQSYEIAGGISAIDEQENAAKGLYNCYKAINDYQSSLYWFERYTEHKDSVYNEGITKEITQKEFQYAYEKKTLADSIKQVEERKLFDARIHQEKTQRYTLYGGLTLVMVFAGFMFNRFLVTNRQKIIIEEKNHIVEEKQKEILDSIYYAKRIQDALLKEEDHVSEHLPEHFVLFQPKDIVSGDFYWASEKQNHLYMAAADCTGHGVPGAMMSMLGISFLNEIISVPTLITPAEILNQLRERIVKELGSSGSTKDGMDISLCSINLTTKEVQWAGANNPLWYCGSGKLTEIKPDKQPIGYSDKYKPFTNHSINEKGIYYLFTDGYADQFGGPKGKKFKYKQLEEKLLAVSDLSLSQQKEKLMETFNNWKGKQEQVDDVCIIGVKV